MKNIRLADMKCEGYTLGAQMEKIDEEVAELLEAIDDGTNPQEKNQAIAEEAFDVMQACYTLLKILKLDVAQANCEHLQKLHGRHCKL